MSTVMKLQIKVMSDGRSNLLSQSSIAKFESIRVNKLTLYNGKSRQRTKNCRPT